MEIVLFDKLSDVVVGIATTFIGIVLVYVVARPRLKFDDVLHVSRRRSGKDRYRVRFRASNRRLRITQLHVMVDIKFTSGKRGTTIPVPLSKTDWYGIRRPDNRHNWNSSPRLLMQEIEWRRHLPPEIRIPKSRDRLEEIMEALDARLIVTIVATSAVFGVSKVFRMRYTASTLAAGVDDETSEVFDGSVINDESA